MHKTITKKIIQMVPENDTQNLEASTRKCSQRKVLLKLKH